MVNFIIINLYNQNQDNVLDYSCIYNIWVISGISYLSKAQEAKALQNLCSVHQNGLRSFSSDSEEYAEIPAVRTADVLFTERMKIRFHEWHENVLKYPKDPILEGNHCSSNLEFQIVFFKMHPAVMLNGFTSHRLKLIQLVRMSYMNFSAKKCQWLVIIFSCLMQSVCSSNLLSY